MTNYTGNGGRPNILFIFSDQMRAMAMGCAGNDQVHTPNFDRLAAEGARFSRAYCNFPVCTPSRGTILTGQYPLTHRAITNGFELPEGAPTIARSLKENGYRTVYAGKWHLDGDELTGEWKLPGPYRHGFDECLVPRHSHTNFDAPHYQDSPEPVEVEGYVPTAHTNFVMDFIEQEDDRPFCAFLAWGPPHAPFNQVPEKFLKMYEGENLPELRPNAEPIFPNGTDHPAQTLLWAAPFKKREVGSYENPRHVLAHYYALITSLDHEFGRILDFLDEQGLSDNTIVVYTSDHGEMMWSHGQVQKMLPHEESINIPFLIRWPGKVSAGEVNEALLGTVDMAPSLLGLAGVTPPEEMEGTDYSAVITGAQEDGAKSVLLTNIARGWRGIRTDRYTYVRLTEEYMEQHVPLQEPDWILFDNEADPYQFKNLVYHPDYQDVREELKAELEQWLDRSNDPFHPDQIGHIKDLNLVEKWDEIQRRRNPKKPQSSC